MEKVKLTQEQSYAIEQLRTYDFEDVLIMRRRKDMPYLYSSLDSLTVDELGSIFFNPDSYEVEETFKVGDWIYDKVTHETSKINTQGRAEGISNYPYNFRYATPEEIKAEKERRVWAEIGREVGEFRGGDIGISKNGNTYRDNPSMLSKLHVLKNLKGFYPAESFIKFGGESHDN